LGASRSSPTCCQQKKLTLAPADVDESDVEAVAAAGVTPAALRDAVEVAAAFNTIDRIADALDFAPQSEASLAASTHQLTTRGYA
jgi:hypothetical protein